MSDSPKKAPRAPRKRLTDRHPLKAKASLLGAILGIVAGCSTFPLGSTVRLICGTATGIIDVVDKARSARVDSGVELDASVDIALIRDN